MIKNNKCNIKCESKKDKKKIKNQCKNVINCTIFNKKIKQIKKLNEKNNKLKQDINKSNDIDIGGGAGSSNPQCNSNQFLNSNNQCQALRQCTNTEFETLAPTSTSDRECQTLRQCTTTNKYK